MKYSGIAKASLLIALDNGGINRDRSAEDQAHDLDRWLEDRAQYLFDLAAIDVWLSGLDQAVLEAVCTDSEAVRDVLSVAPTGTDDLLTAYFEDVC